MCVVTHKKRMCMNISGNLVGNPYSFVGNKVNALVEIE